jgi:hypothetical protein
MRMSREKTIMPGTNKKFVQILSDLMNVCLNDLGSSMNRAKSETLVTVHVHQKYVLQ